MDMLPLGGVKEIQMAKGREGSLTHIQNDEHQTLCQLGHLGQFHGDDSGFGASAPLPMMKHPQKKQHRFWSGIEGRIDDVACSWERVAPRSLCGNWERWRKPSTLQHRRGPWRVLHSLDELDQAL